MLDVHLVGMRIELIDAIVIDMYRLTDHVLHWMVSTFVVMFCLIRIEDHSRDNVVDGKPRCPRTTIHLAFGTSCL